MKTSTRIKWKDRTPENDIKYGGFLSYRHIRIIGWFCLAVAQVAFVLKLQAKLAPSTTNVIDAWNMVISVFASLPVPLFLLANISTILQKRGDYKPLFIRFGAFAAGMYILANFVVMHYGFRTLHALDNEVGMIDAMKIFGTLLPALGKSGYTLNIFIDMLIIVLLFYFANHEPAGKFFQGKKVYLFRALTILPIAYEVGGIVVKYYLSMGQITELPSPVFFLLPSKPPLVFAAFVIIVIGLKLSEWRYLRRPGHTKETFELHATTKAHSLKISIGMAAVFVVLAIIDLILILLLTIASINKYSDPALYPGLEPEAINELVYSDITVYDTVGFGGAIGLLLIAPLVLLFSYTKTHKNPNLDILVPIGGIVLIALVLLEGTFQVITLNVSEFTSKLKEALDKYLNGGSSAPKQVRMFLGWIQSFHP